MHKVLNAAAIFLYEYYKKTAQNFAIAKRILFDAVQAVC